jgi:hypothetical protein
MNKELDAVLNFDGLAAAENFTGKSYKDDDITSTIGWVLSVSNNQQKNAMLENLGDTSFSRDMPWMRAFLIAQGFDLIHTHSFNGYDDTVPETVEFFWNPEGILFKLESHRTTRMNTCHAYFNWKPNDERSWPRGLSGGFYDGVFVGDLDAREAFAYRINQMRGDGQFLPVWHKRPFLWLLSYDDSKVTGYDYNAINAERIAQFPQHVQDAIKGA